jgi:hypothetical protein
MILILLKNRFKNMSRNLTHITARMNKNHKKLASKIAKATKLR